MKKKLIRAFVVSGFASLLLVSFCGFVFSQITYDFFWRKEVVFNLSSYGVDVKFVDDIYVGGLSFVNGMRLDFSDIYLTENIEDFRVTTQGCNITVNDLTDGLLNYTVSDAGNQTVYVEGNALESVIIDGLEGLEGIDYSVSGDYVTVYGALVYAELSFSESVLDGVSDLFRGNGLAFFGVIVGLCALVLVLANIKRKDDY